MIKLKSVICSALIGVVCVNAVAQTSLVEPEQRTDTKLTVPFYKWEIGIDVLPLADKAKDAFGYVVKRNFQTSNGRRALRLKFLPSLSASFVGGTVSNTYLYTAVGYEWQKLYGRFAALYGVEPFFRYSHNVIKGQNSAAGSDIKQINTGLSGLLGGRYYLGGHFALTIESHLIYNFYSSDITNTGNVASGYARQHTEYVNPIHAVYFSYHF